jgi:hypothetical protein
MKTALTDRAIKAMRAAGKAYDVHDAVVPGLSLNVLPSGLKRFVLIKRFPGARNPTRRALDAYGALSLEAARNKARAWLELIAGGIDPAAEAEREQRAQERKRRTTFKAVVEDYIASEVIGLDPAKPRHRTPAKIWMIGSEACLHEPLKLLRIDLGGGVVSARVMILKGLVDRLDVGGLSRCGGECSERQECKDRDKSDRLAAPPYHDLTLPLSRDGQFTLEI